MSDVLRRIGKGLVSFGTGIPQIELDRMAIANRDAAAAADINEARAAAIPQEQARQADMRRLQVAAANGDSNAMRELTYRFPEVAQNVVKSAGLANEIQRNQMEVFLSNYLANSDNPEIQEQMLRNRSAGLLMDGRSPAETLSAFDVPPEQRNVPAAALLESLRSIRLGSSGQLPANIREFEFLADAGELSPEDKVKAARIAQGLEARAGTSAEERIANDPNLGQRVADQAALEEEATTFAGKTAAARAEDIDAATKEIAGLQSNMRDLQTAIDAVEEGSVSGPFISRFPSIRESSVKLEQIRNQLGLNVVGATSFGNLSEGELELALMTAMPDKLRGPALKKWLQDRRNAQFKLMDYFYEQIEFLNAGGTTAGFITYKRNKAISDAREAIEKGADRDAVINRLQRMGISGASL